jgi:adenylate kinase
MAATIQGPRLVLLGRQGAGKGTQGAKLATHLGVAHMATGTILRQAVEERSPLGRRVGRYLNQGRLVPNELILHVVGEKLESAEIVRRGFLLDGFPRTVPQAQALDEMLAGLGQHIDRLLYLHVDLEELVQRLTGRWVCPSCARSYHKVNNPPLNDMRCNVDGTGLVHRDDDTEETARRRAEVFYQRTYPILEFYKQRGISVEIDGQGAIADVRGRVREALAGSTRGAA